MENENESSEELLSKKVSKYSKALATIAGLLFCLSIVLPSITKTSALQGLSIIPIILIPYISLVIVGLPHRGSIELEVKREKAAGLIIPNICVITGDNATRMERFSGADFHCTLPFSDNGWNKYCNYRAISFLIFKSGFNTIFKIPFLGPYLAVTLWSIFAGYLCGIIAIYEMIMGKRQLVKLYGLSMTEEALISMHLSVLSRRFADEFVKQNTNLTLEQCTRSRTKHTETNISKAENAKKRAEITMWALTFVCALLGGAFGEFPLFGVIYLGSLGLFLLLNLICRKSTKSTVTLSTISIAIVLSFVDILATPVGMMLNWRQSIDHSLWVILTSPLVLMIAVGAVILRKAAIEIRLGKT